MEQQTKAFIVLTAVFMIGLLFICFVGNIASKSQSRDHTRRKADLRKREADLRKRKARLNISDLNS
jgi:hypothetical protein